jgi:hypothetical protein
MGRPPLRCDGGQPTDERSLPSLLDALASTLRATEELPVAPSASVWLGEAHAVAADLAGDDVAPSVVHERVGHVHRLLTNAGDVENEAVAAHVADAIALTETILARTGDATDGEGP